MKLHERLKEFRINAGKKQHELASLLGIKQSYLSEVEKGRRKVSIKFVLRFCEALNLQDDMRSGLSDLLLETYTMGFPNEVDTPDVMRTKLHMALNFIIKTNGWLHDNMEDDKAHDLWQESMSLIECIENRPSNHSLV